MNDTDQRLSLERRVVSLEEKNGRLTSALTAARTELIRLQGELADVSRPPQTLATFVRAFPAARQIEVVTGGKRMRVAVSPKLDVTDLSYGQWVRLDDTPPRAARRLSWSSPGRYVTATCAPGIPSSWMHARVSRSNASCARTSSSSSPPRCPT